MVAMTSSKLRALRDRWQDYVFCDQRLQLEGPFLWSCAEPTSALRVLDAAGGIGCEAIWYASKGCRVTCNEIDEVLQAVAVHRARRFARDIEFTSVLWEDISRAFAGRSWDVTLLTGNSLSLCESKDECYAVVRDLAELTEPTGRMVVDTRNYDYLAHLYKNATTSCMPIPFSGRIIYSNRLISINMIGASKDVVTLQYCDRRSGDVLEELPLLRLSLDDIIGMCARFRQGEPIICSDFVPGINSSAEFFTVIS